MGDRGARSRRRGSGDRARHRHARRPGRPVRRSRARRRSWTSRTGLPSSPRWRGPTATSGDLDVVVNNAGYGQYGMVEELPSEDRRDLIDTNLFGAFGSRRPHCHSYGTGSRALPPGRARSAVSPPARTSASITRRSGRLKGISESLAQEVAGFGIKVTMSSPTGYATDCRAAHRPGTRRRSGLRRLSDAGVGPANRVRTAPGDPAASRTARPRRRRRRGAAVADLPRRRAAAILTADYESRLATWRKWDEVSTAAHGGRT